MKKTLFVSLSILVMAACAQTKETTYTQKKSKNQYYWQQHADYTMDIDMDVNNFQYRGVQKLLYTNNSPDELNKVFYHLYLMLFNQVLKWIFVL